MFPFILFSIFAILLTVSLSQNCQETLFLQYGQIPFWYNTCLNFQ